MHVRERLIRNGLNRWHTQTNFKGILKYATGTGKSFAIILAAEYFSKKYPSERVLIVCPTTEVIENLIGEFIKFKRKNLIERCNFICYASLTKVKNFYPLVIMDEIHHVTSDNRMSYFKTIKYEAILGLTASLTFNQTALLSPYLRIADTINLDKANEKELVANYTLINFGVRLTPSESLEYKKLTDSINYASLNYKKRAWGKISQRSNLLYNGKNKLEMLPRIVELFDKEYGIIFSLTKEQADNISDLLGDKCISIHSGKNKKEKQLLKKAFSDGRTKIRIISTAKLFDEGVTLPRLTYSVAVSRYSKERQTIQNIGRVVRTDIPEKHSIFIRLYLIGTQEEEWVKYSQKGFKCINVTSYEELRKIINQIRGRLD